jgi:iron(III) transport system ATP-binding protein
MADLRIAGLAKAFDSQMVLQNINLNVASGRLVAILGASGSGKTTLLRLICGFDRADTGAIEVDGQLVAAPGLHMPTQQRRIGYVAQEGALFPHLSVADNIAFGLPRRARRTRHRVDQLLELVGLATSFADRPPQALSGGEQQRVALARALAPAPNLVLLDEPFSALDAASRADTRVAVAAALAAAGATALLVTHDQAEALSMGYEVAVLRHGHLVQVAAPMTLYRQPKDAALAGFVGEAVVLPAIAKAGRARCALGELILDRPTPDGCVDVLVRPEQIRLENGDSSDGVPALVRDITFYGHDARVDLQLVRQIPEQDAVSPLFARVAGHQIPARGSEVRIYVDGGVISFPTNHIPREADRDQPPQTRDPNANPKQSTPSTEIAAR